MKHFTYYFSKNYLPRWMVFLFDLGVVFFSWYSAFLLRLNFDLSSMEAFLNPWHMIVVFPVIVFCFWKSKSYSGILRHSTTHDIIRIIVATLCAGMLLTIISLTGRLLNDSSFVNMPISVIVIFSMLVSTLLVLSRIFAKMIFQQWFIPKKDVQKVMIFGAGGLGQTALNALNMDVSINTRVVGFIDDNASLHNKRVVGIPIYSVSSAFNKIIPENKVTEIIFAVDSSEITQKRKREITDMCLDLQLVLKEVPPIKNWIKGELHAKTIRPIKIEDLLGRNSIHLDRKKIE